MEQQTENESRQAMVLIGAVVAVLIVAGGLAAVGVQQAKQQPKVEVVKALETYTNSIGMQFAKIPGGRFQMGDDAPDRGPIREVEVAPFYMGTTEVTQAQWQAVMGDNPSHYKDPQRPVDNVTWVETQFFLEQLNRMEGTNKYRLPSEAEWEYAARAGSDGRYFFGSDMGQMKRYAWFDAAENIGTRRVGERRPNPWGLFDIYGNVWEWVQDCWHDNYIDAPANSKVWGGGDCAYRVVRGGGWSNKADYLGSTVRGSYEVRFEDFSNGFRVALNP